MSVKINGLTGIEFTSNTQQLKFKGDTQNFNLKTVGDDFNIYNNDVTKLWGITDTGWTLNPNVPAFYGSDLSPNTVGRFARANVILVNKGNHITHVSPDGNERTRFNAPVTGLYHAWMGNIGGNTAGTLRMHFYINGTSQYPQLRTAQVNTNHGTSASMVGIFEMNAGDYLEWYSYDNYGWYSNLYSHIGCYLIG